jgi:N-methylhydantoinase B
MAHTVSASSQSASIDPISFEVIRNKLQAIVEEQAITLQNVSGSPVVTEATDFNCGLYLADGSIVVMGPQVIMFAGIMSSVIRSVIDTARHNPGIREGDMFVFNDPYRGAIHQPDISIVAPIFCYGVHVAWVGACAHQLDIGGMTFGSMAYAATEIQQEALLLSGIRIIEQGNLREDIWQMIMGMTRLPHVVALDLKAMIAANNVAIRRFNEMVDRYGVDVVVNVMKAEIGASESRLRQRLRQIPDGTYRARDFLEHDGHSNRLYDICVSVLKEGDTLTFDMEGSSPQAPGFINCTYSGLKGALFSGLLPILAPDMRWNEGVLHPIIIRAPEASVCNAKWPAPVSGATICAAWVVVNATVAALSRMVACTPGWLQEGQAVTKGHQMILTLAGADRDGSPYGTFFMDALAGGGGAFVDHDGLDGSGDYVIPRPSIANVEAHEAGGPILFLYRSFLPNTAGAGRTRGGYSASLAVTPHDVEDLHSMIIGHGVEVPNTAGLFGGRPGACGTNLVKKNGGSVESLVREIGSGQDFIKVGQRMGAKPGNMPFHRGDVLGYTIQGGGGYGDPIVRNPDLVAAEVAEGFLTPHWAEVLYGVIVNSEGHPDLERTRANRAKIRCDRLAGKQPERDPPQDEDLPHLRVRADRHTLCGCGYDLAAPNESWKQRAVHRPIEPEACGPYVHLHEELQILEFVCPKCATLLEVEVCRHEQEPLTTMVINPR